MKQLFFVLFSLGLFLVPVNTEAQMRGVCGTTHSHEQDQRILRHKAALETSPAINYRDGITYVPVKFHIMRRSDGTGGVSEGQILNALCKLNDYFEDQDIQFYMYGTLSFINNTNAFNNPGDFPLILNSVRVGKAMNVYIGEKADPPGGGGLGNTLGYYSPGFDWLVVKRGEINSSSSTLAHEAGHYFSLAHPFNGWDCTSWDPEVHGIPLNITTAPCSDVPVELADGSNCNTAGDFLCDTPADYNLGFGAGGCTYNGNCQDPNGNLLNPMTNNMMGYFTNCPNYIFTPMQKALIAEDLANRNGLDTDFTPIATTITETPELVSPIGGGTFSGYNDMAFSWTPVDGADKYFLEIDISPTFSISPIRMIVYGYFKRVPLMANANYHWRVRPFNSYYACAPNTATANFKTDNIVAVSEPVSVQEVLVVPNPAVAGNQVDVLLETREGFDAHVSVFAMDGRRIIQFPNRFATGPNRLNIPTENLRAGIYLISIESKEGGVVNRKFILSE